MARPADGLRELAARLARQWSRLLTAAARHRRYKSVVTMDDWESNVAGRC